MSADTPDTTSRVLDPARWLQDHGDVLFRYALGKIRDTAQAEDLVQETLLAAFQNRENYSGRASEQTWLIGILKHKIIDLIRKQLRESTVDNIASLADLAAESGVDDLFDARGHWINPPRDWGLPDKSLGKQQFLDALEHCLGRLKPAQAEIFEKKELAGLSIDEICKELEITATNCSVMLYRARMGLRRCLEIRWAGHNREEFL